MTPIKLGFIPLTDAAPLIVAAARGFFAAEGLDVELSREASWATVRDKVSVGALQGAQMLAPMALAVSLGVGSEAAEIVAPLVLSRGGAAVVLSERIPIAELADRVRRRQAQGSSPLTFAVVFPYSTHAYLMRHWLSGIGLDPDADVLLTVAPPQRMAELLAGGVIEGFCCSEPWPSVSAAAGVGAVAATALATWPDAPDKVLGLHGGWAAAEPRAAAALVRALDRAAAWIEDPEHRRDLLAILAAREHVGAEPALIEAGLGHARFHAGGANRPTSADAAWLASQMDRWKQTPDAAAARRKAAAMLREDLFEAALRQPSA